MKVSHKLTLITSVIAIILTSGCSSQPKPLYNYEDYSDSYYHYKKNAGEKSALEYKQNLEKAIENAGDGSSARVAPGLYADLGYTYLKGGNNQKAIEYFTKEKTIYPESAHFMDRMIQKIQTNEGDKK
jgi:hypothetical protein